MNREAYGSDSASLAAPARRGGPARTSRLSRFRVLYNISNILTTTRRSEDVLRLILKEAVKATRATSGSLVLIDREAGVLDIQITENIDPVRASKLKLKIGQGVTGWVAKTGKTLRVNDVRRSPHYVSLKSAVQSELAAPLIINGEVVGILNVDSDLLNAFGQEDEELMVAIAAQSSRVMQAANLYAENRRRSERLASLFAVARAIASEPILDRVLQRIADEARGLVNARMCSIMLLAEKGEDLEIKAVSGEISPRYLNRKRIPVQDNVIGRATLSGKPVYIRDVREEKGYRLRAVARASGLCSLLSIPMMYLGRAIGVLNIYSGKPAEFSAEDVGLVSALAGHSSVAIVNAQRYERIIKSEELLRESEKFQLLGTLSAEIAHEIRNPLTIISMLAHTVLEDPGISAESRNDLSVMETKLRHINKIVDQVLDFSRTNKIERESVDVNKILEDVQMLVGVKAAAMGRRVEHRPAPKLPAILGDPGQLEQAVLNLALNGLESMKTRGGKLLLSSAAAGEGAERRVSIRVRDEGVGIPKEKLQQIFTPYFSMSEHGTGLGLFITRRIVTQHGGELRVTSKVGSGTTFEILLPAADSGAEAARESA